MKSRRCKNKNCRCLFEVSSRNPDQKYCSKEKCQKMRKAERQRRKITNDVDYQIGQDDCKEKWKTKNPDYWKKYREKNPKYTKKNREKQKERDQKKRDQKEPNQQKRVSKPNISISQNLAKMHPSKPQEAIISGTYELIPVTKQSLAKMHPLIVEIKEITVGYNRVL